MRECSGCAARREAIKVGVGKVVKAVSALASSVVGIKGENAGRKTVQQGWTRRK
jgi:hypothetical protein